MLTEAMQSFSLYKIFDVVNREYKKIAGPDPEKTSF